MKYRRDIDGLRAIAVLAVVLFHARVPGFSGGFVGVDVFFVISGFLIASVIQRDVDRERFRVRRFFSRRFKRLIPALLVVLCVSVLLAVPIAAEHELRTQAQNAAAAAVYGANIFLWRTAGYFAPSAEELSLLHTWSLSIEEQFYLLFPWLFVLFGARSRRLLVWLGFGVSFLASVYMTSRGSSAGFFLLPFRAWELAAGVLLAMYRPALPVSWEAPARLAGVVAILLPTALYDHDTPFPGIWAVPPVLGSLLVLQAGRGGGGRDWLNRLLESRWMVGIGLVSYSLYLWHWPLLVYARYYLAAGALVLPAWATAVALGASGVLAFASWRLVEEPVRRSALEWRGSFALGALGVALPVSLWVAVETLDDVDVRLGERAATYARDARDRHRMECILRPGQRLDGKKPCRFGSEGAPRVALWGDSHAHAWMPALDSPELPPGVLLSMASCAPLLGIELEDGKRKCREFNDWALEQIARTPTLEVVVLAARWAPRATGTASEPRPPHPIRDVVGDVEGTPLAVFSAGFERTVQALRELDREIIVVTPGPEFPFAVPDSLVVADRLGLEPRGVPTAAAVRHRGREVLALLEHTSGVRVVDPVADLCPDLCSIEHEHHALYTDAHHLTSRGAAAFGGRIRSAVVSAL